MPSNKSNVEEIERLENQQIANTYTHTDTVCVCDENGWHLTSTKNKLTDTVGSWIKKTSENEWENAIVMWRKISDEVAISTRIFFSCHSSFSFHYFNEDRYANAKKTLISQ